MTSPVIDAAGLAGLLESDGLRSRVRIVDVRWRLDRPDGRPDFMTGHIPGAVYVPLDDELAAHGLPATEGRHPLPELEDLQDAARRWGVRDGDTVVAYDDLGGMSAARAWWLLRHAGVADVRVLDGGLSAWIDEGLPLETGDTVPEPGDVTLAYGSMPVLDADAAGALPDRGALIDARAGERYRGEVEPIDPRAGHIPGAVNLPARDWTDHDGRLLDDDTLAERLDAVPGEIVSSCGSGVTACHTLLVLEHAGRTGRLYPGSFSQWSNDPSRPVATGADPG